MSNEEQVDSYRPQFRDAFKEILQANSSTFGLRDLRLKESADLTAWEPDDVILSHLPNINDINIELIDESTNLEEVLEIFRQERSLGLVVMGQTVSRESKATLIVISTSFIYYVFDPNANNCGLELLKRALQEPGLTIWTTNGLFEADCLYHNYNIKLLDSNARCCLGLHIQLMSVISLLPQEALRGTDEQLSQHMYPREALILARQSEYAITSFPKLLRTWLSLDNENVFDIDPTQTIHLETRPLSLTAKNLIKKRCCLILRLAEALEFYTLSEFSTMNRRVLDCLSDGSRPHTTEMQKIMLEDEKSKTVSHIYLSHLDAPNLCEQPTKPLISLSNKQA